MILAYNAGKKCMHMAGKAFKFRGLTRETRAWKSKDNIWKTFKDSVKNSLDNCFDERVRKVYDKMSAIQITSGKLSSTHVQNLVSHGRNFTKDA